MLNDLLQKLISIFSTTHDAATGKKGFVAIADTDAHTGVFFAITTVGGAAVLNSAGTISREGDSVINNHSIPDGFTLYGNWSSVQLASGNAYSYHDGEV